MNQMSFPRIHNVLLNDSLDAKLLITFMDESYLYLNFYGLQCMDNLKIKYFNKKLLPHYDHLFKKMEGDPHLLEKIKYDTVKPIEDQKKLIVKYLDDIKESIYYNKTFEYHHHTFGENNSYYYSMPIILYLIKSNLGEEKDELIIKKSYERFNLYLKEKLD